MILKDKINSRSFIEYGDEQIRLGAGIQNITIDSKAGTIFNTPVSFTSNPLAMRFGGVYKLNPLALTTMPSTMITPIPTFEVDVPAQQSIALLTSISAFLGAV